MKKANFPMVLSTAVICFIFWLLISGELAELFMGEVKTETLIIGILVSVGTALFTARFFIHEEPFRMFHPLRVLTLIFYCLCVFMIEVVKANWDVAKRALSPKLPVKPGIVKIPVGLKSEYGLSMLADSITLTPGTITMDVVEQDGQNYFYVHWIDVASEDPVEAGNKIKGTLEKWVGRIWK